MTQSHPEVRLPTRWESAVFRGKVLAFQVRRLAGDSFTADLRRHPCVQEKIFPVALAQSRSPLWADPSVAERSMQLGKVHNLRIAARRLNGILLPAGTLFSFWKQVGRATGLGGYVQGRELREGCLIPAVGGGLCQLSNALYQVALDAGCEIVERHAHSRVVPGSAASSDRDATVFWNYVDLRWRPPCDALLEVKLTPDELIVTLRGLEKVKPPASPEFVNMGVSPIVLVADSHAPRSCMSCGMESCHRHPGAMAVAAKADTAEADTAYMLDEQWPEFLEYVRGSGSGCMGTLLVPRLRNPQWARTQCGFRQVRQAVLPALRRSIDMRRLARGGAPGNLRRSAELAHTASIAEFLGKRLPWNAQNAVVAQSFLPFLQMGGHLAGRRYDVLMTRLPMRELHRRLDAAFSAHPERGSLVDFRASAAIVDSEWEAIVGARRIVTPHPEIAALFPEQAVLIDWMAPVEDGAPTDGNGFRSGVYFPGPTAARKGAFEMRAVARDLDIEILLSGSELEGSGFWSGVKVSRMSVDECLSRARAVVQPAIIEDQPRTLLRALALGTPVIATEVCGLEPQPALTIVGDGCADSLAAAVKAALQNG